MTTTIMEKLKLKMPQVYYVPRKSLDDAGTDTELLYGIELEIEGLEGDDEARAARKVPGMEYHEDRSLRNNGGEFVTLPMRRNAIAYVLDQFFQKNKLTQENYSERCSVHVHANCGDLTSNQLRLILCLYQILERVLFNFVKESRDENIFCVPWSESLIGTNILREEDSLLEDGKYSWRKYTALNVLPLYTQGTIEFRHMAGTSNLEFILTWCDIIGCLFKYARTHKFDDVINTLMGLNTSSAYATFMMDVFTPSIYEVLAVGRFKELLEEGVLNMKIMLMSPLKQEVKRAKPGLAPGNPDPLAGWVDFNNLPPPAMEWGGAFADGLVGRVERQAQAEDQNRMGWFQANNIVPAAVNPEAPRGAAVGRNIQRPAGNPFEDPRLPRVPRPPRNLGR